MKPSTELLNERGSGIVDLIGFGVLLQVPVLIFSTFALSLQHQQFAIEAIARHATRAQVLLPSNSNTAIVVREIARDFGLNESDLDWKITCSPDIYCLEPGSIVRFEIKLGSLSAESLQAI